MYQYLVSKVRYPPEARRLGISGEVVAQFTVLPNGTVDDIRIVSSPSPLLSSAMSEALEHMAREVTWIPGIQHGVAVPMQKTVPMSFTLGLGSGH